MNEPDDPEASVSSLPATMADIFLALVAVVIMMLLSLVPAIRTPGALAAPAPFDVSRADVSVDGKRPTLLVAEEDGLRQISPERLVPLDRMLDDADLARALDDASARSEPILLMIRPEGQEAAFLFESLAQSLGVEAIEQLRLDEDCGYVTDAGLAQECRRSPRSAAP